MKITVISDTHKEYHMLKNVVEANLDSDMFIHLGDGEYEVRDVSALYPDKKFIFVGGECDFGEHSTMEIVNTGLCRILCTHGHELDVNNGLDALIELANENQCQQALFGHTHLYRTGNIDGVYIMNPGSISSPRGKNKPSYGIIRIDDDSKISMDIIAYKE